MTLPSQWRMWCSERQERIGMVPGAEKILDTGR